MDKPGRTWLGLLCGSAGLVVILLAVGVGAGWIGVPWQSSTDSEPPGLPFFALDADIMVASSFFRPIRDPLSLEEIRESFDRAGYRGAETLERELARGPLDAATRMRLLGTSAVLYLYEGDTDRAAAAIAEARKTAESHAPRFRAQLPAIIALQGIVALRRAETENCVAQQNECSCIFPLRPEAVHSLKEGSSDAVQFFSEYLRRRPDDLSVRWLLNVAYMTLGDYPEKVPEDQLIPLAPFESHAHVGRFVDVAAAAGVNRLDQSGGAIMDDFNNDGLLDLVETSWDPAVPMALYLNRGDGTFDDRSETAGLSGQLGGLYCVQADYDNDGWLDLFVPRGAWLGRPMRPSLLRNNGDGTFRDRTEEAGLLTPVTSQVATWADYDNDGWLDLFVGNESWEEDAFAQRVRARARLYHNRGDGTFEEVALKAGVDNGRVVCKGANWGDFDGDGFSDLYVSNYNAPNRLFRNQGDGTFRDVAAELGVSKPDTGFSCWFWDYDNDGRLDLFAAGFEFSLDDLVESHLGRPHQAEPPRLYRNLGGRFEDVTQQVGLDLALAPMGSNYFDVDNDGFLDFYLGTGNFPYSCLVPNRMFKNVEGKRFVDVTVSSGTGHLQKGHAVAGGDWDRDGDVDIYAQLGGATPGDRFRNALFLNPGSGNNWITVRLMGVESNRAGVGARIKVVLREDGGERAIYRHVTSGSSFGANPLQQTIGVGQAERIARLEVDWPTSGTTQVFEDVPVNGAIEITEFSPQWRDLEWKAVVTARDAATALARE